MLFQCSKNPKPHQTKQKKQSNKIHKTSPPETPRTLHSFYTGKSPQSFLLAWARCPGGKSSTNGSTNLGKELHLSHWVLLEAKVPLPQQASLSHMADANAGMLRDSPVQAIQDPSTGNTATCPMYRYYTPSPMCTPLKARAKAMTGRRKNYLQLSVGLWSQPRASPDQEELGSQTIPKP